VIHESPCAQSPCLVCAGRCDATRRRSHHDLRHSSCSPQQHPQPYSNTRRTNGRAFSISNHRKRDLDFVAYTWRHVVTIRLRIRSWTSLTIARARAMVRYCISNSSEWDSRTYYLDLDHLEPIRCVARYWKTIRSIGSVPEAKTNHTDMNRTVRSSTYT
jgi:hypothetical protein